LLIYLRLKHSDWLHLTDEKSQEILLGHAIFASSEYGMTQLLLYCTFN